MSDKKKSNITFLHNVKNETIVNGKKTDHEEYVIHGEKGLFVKYFYKEGDKSEKITIKSEGDKFKVTTFEGKDKKDVTMTKDELLKEMGKNKNLKFAVEYIKTQKGGKKKSKKTSKSAPKKTSKKTSQKGGKKKSKKASKSAPKKTSKKTSKKK